MNDAALDAYKDALRSAKRDGKLLKPATAAAAYTSSSARKPKGRKDLERVYADDPKYRDVAELLQADIPAS
jgi:hypothetical protein